MAIRRAFAQVVLLLTLAYGVCPRGPVTPAQCAPPPACAPVPDCDEAQSCRRCPKAPPTREAHCRTCESGILALASETDRRPEPEAHCERPALVRHRQTTVPAFRTATLTRRIDVRSASPPLHLLDATFRT